MRIDSTIAENDPRMPATWRVLSALLRDEPLSQADLRERTGLSHPVIVQRVAQLRQAGLISMGKPSSGRPGRPRTPMSFNWDYRRLLVVEVHNSGVTALISNLHGEALAAPVVLSVQNWNFSEVATALEAAITVALAQEGAPWAGIAVVLPGAVSADGASIRECSGLPECRDLALGTELSAKFGYPVTLYSDGTTLASAAWAARDAAAQTIIAVSLRHEMRIGLGLIVEGRLVASAGSAPGGLASLSILGGATLGEVLSDTTVRLQGLRSLAEALAPTVLALTPDNLIIQGDAIWSDADADLFHSALQNCCGAEVMRGLRVEVRPYRAQESLEGALGLLSAQLLDLRRGKVGQWARSAVPEPEPIILY